MRSILLVFACFEIAQAWILEAASGHANTWRKHRQQMQLMQAGLQDDPQDSSCPEPLTFKCGRGVCMIFRACDPKEEEVNQHPLTPASDEAEEIS
ncbi:hypothetical protein XA68_12697 [Ophiocordyceps unilateralis]|uniref:Uncharacterized protein n=1 Tax=Ophiocordyceps unilateralis TaxID=268505 RepID=A0A2A9PP03_OPHUN|nr:hypothetical protein XA68_12697 [Ophiocordyceps unilateralis]